MKSPVTFVITFTFGSLKTVSFKCNANFFEASFNIDVWKGPETFNGITLLAPASFKEFCANSTASFSPPITIWLGVL